MALVFLCGCQTSKKEDKQKSAIRIHIEAAAINAGTTKTISVLRAAPVMVTIEKEPIFSEANLVAARVVDIAHGGFAIQLNFDESSSLLLEQYSAANLGRHFLVFGQWGEKLSDGRWLAAPLITRRIFNGTLVFTPDMTRDEAGQFALGLSNVIHEIHKHDLK